MTKEELKQRTKKFALDVFKFLMKMEKTKAVDVVSFQLFKSSSSVAANYRAVCRGKSSADFLNKLKIVDEEADESLFWLEFIQGLEKKYNVDLLDKMNVTFKLGEHIAHKPLIDFKKMVKDKAVTENTIVFNNLVNNIEEFNESWEVPAIDSWHSRFF